MGPERWGGKKLLRSLWQHMMLAIADARAVTDAIILSDMLAPLKLATESAVVTASGITASWLVAILWKDNRSVTMISTTWLSAASSMVSRWSRADGKEARGPYMQPGAEKVCQWDGVCGSLQQKAGVVAHLDEQVSHAVSPPAVPGLSSERGCRCEHDGGVGGALPRPRRPRAGADCRIGRTHSGLGIRGCRSNLLLP